MLFLFFWTWAERHDVTEQNDFEPESFIPEELFLQ